MPAREDLGYILARLRAASDRLTTAQVIVVEQGGQWTEAADQLGVFELQLAGFAGIGPSAHTAIEDWMIQAQDILAQPAAPLK